MMRCEVVWVWDEGQGLEVQGQEVESLCGLSGLGSHRPLITDPEWTPVLPGPTMPGHPALSSAASMANVPCVPGHGLGWWAQSWHSSVAGLSVSRSLWLLRPEAPI